MALFAPAPTPSFTAITECRTVDGRWAVENFPVLVRTAREATTPANSVVASCVYPMQCQCAGACVKIHLYIKYEEGGFFSHDRLVMHMKLLDTQDWNTLQWKFSRWMGNFQVFVDKEGRTTVASPIPTQMFDCMQFMYDTNIHENGYNMFDVRDMHKHVDVQGKLNLRIKITHCPCAAEDVYVPALAVPPPPLQTPTKIPEKKEINGEPKRLAEYITPPNFEIKVTSGGEKTFRCHTMVLTSKSPVFVGMIRNTNFERPMIGYEDTDISAETMDHFLDFLYFERFYGAQTSLVSCLPELAEAADKYSVAKLLEFCDLNLHRAANETNALEIMNLAGRLGLKHAEQEVGKLVGKNTDEPYQNYDMDSLDSDEDEDWLPPDEADEANDEA